MINIPPIRKYGVADIINDLYPKKEPLWRKLRACAKDCREELNRNLQKYPAKRDDRNEGGKK